jgi:hypothetical protein
MDALMVQDINKNIISNEEMERWNSDVQHAVVRRCTIVPSPHLIECSLFTSRFGAAIEWQPAHHSAG